MNNAATLVGLITVGASLVLALRAYRSRGLPPQKTLLMILAWVIIIAGLALILGRMGAA